MSAQRPPTFGYLSSQDLSAAQALISQIQACRQEAARLNLWRTFHGLHAGEEAIGWEVADRLPRPVVR